MIGEALIDGVGACGREDMFKAVLVEVAQRHVAVVVETARHNRSVYQYANLIAQGVAEHFLLGSGGALQVGPFEHVVVLDVEIYGNAPAVVTFSPRARLMAGYHVKNGLVKAVVAAFVPQTQHDDAPTAGGFHGKRHHFVDVLL